MKVSKYEYMFVTQLWWFGKFRTRVRSFGLSYTIGLIIIYIGFHILGYVTGDPIFTWLARGLLVFILFGWIYDYCQRRVMTRYRS